MPRSASKSTTVVVRSGGKVKKSKRIRRNASTRQSSSGYMPGCDCTLEYFQSLINPFEFGDIKVGWGCMVPTTAVQAYFRGSTTAGTDGSLTIAILPCVTLGIVVWNTTASTVNGTAVNFGNATAISANCAEGRVISVGVRAFPNIALTAVPGAAYSGATVASTFVTFDALSTNDFIQLPTSHQSIGTPGVSSTGRPVDPESFIFSPFSVNTAGYTGATGVNISLPFSVPYVSFLGLPAGLQVFFEVVMNIEATQVVAHAASTILPDSPGEQRDVVGDHWPSPDALYRAIAPYLPHPGRPGEAAAASDSSFLNTMWRTISGIGKFAGKALGSAALKSIGGPLASSAAQRLLGYSGGLSGSGQRYGRQFAGYLQ